MEVPKEEETSRVDRLAPLSYQDSRDFHTLFAKETDRGAICVADGYLDRLVKDLFKAGFIDSNESKDAIMCLNYGTRLRLAFCLGWIGAKPFTVAKHISKIRNQMAHRFEVDSFDHPDIRGPMGSIRKLMASSESLTDMELLSLAVAHVVGQVWIKTQETRKPVPYEQLTFVTVPEKL